MPLSVAVRRSLAFGLKSQSVAKEIVDVVDAGSGSISDDARNRIMFACISRDLGDSIGDKIEAGSALSGREQAVLGQIMNSRPLAQELAEALAE